MVSGAALWSESGAGPAERSVLVASEPLRPGGRWRGVRDAGMVVVHPDLEVEERPLPNLG